MTCIKQLKIHCMEKSQTRLTACHSSKRPQLPPFYVIQLLSFQLRPVHLRQGDCSGCVCTYIYIYIRTHIHTHPYVYRYDYIHLYIYVCTLVENLTNKNMYNIIMCVHIYTNVYIQLHLTNSAISTYKVGKENVRRNNVHSRCPFIARLECIVCIPFSLMCLGKQQ